MPSEDQSALSADTDLSIVDTLSALPFPEQEERPDKDARWSGPGFHVAVLRESQDFWDDRSVEIVEAAEQELEDDLTALAALLTDRWGAAETVDLWPYLGLDDPGTRVEAPQPLGYLCNVAGSMKLWRLPSGRWLALTIGQADREFPFELIAAVGETPLPRPTAG